MSLSSVVRRRQRMLVALLGIVLIGILCLIGARFFFSEESELKHLLTDSGTAIIEDAEVVAWQPDPDYKPHAFFVVRKIDEARFRQLAVHLGLTVASSSGLTEAIWRLPTGLAVPNWKPQEVPAGAGLEGSGAVGGGNVWVKWYKGSMFLVVLRSSP